MNYEKNRNKFILVDEQARIDIDSLISNLEKNLTLYSKYIRYFNLDLNKRNQTYHNCMIINLISLLSEKDKIIIIDSVLDSVKTKDKLVVRQLLNDIRKKNHVFLIGKEEND